MKIIKKQNGTELEIALEGRLDTTTAPELEEALGAELSDITEIRFDFSKLDYISSAGLRVLLKAQRGVKSGGKVRIMSPNEIVREVFDVTGFADILTIE